MPKSDRRITRADILPTEQYGAERRDRRRALIPEKARRRLSVGPHATFYFESYDTMWLQVHEMLFIEGGGDAQVDDELMAYNPLIPQGHELVATLMFEIDNPVRRSEFLARLGGVEETVGLTVAGARVAGQAERDIDRTTADGKASAVHFIHFPMTADQVAAFKSGDGEITLDIGHDAYRHMTVLSAETRTALAGDLA